MAEHREHAIEAAEARTRTAEALMDDNGFDRLHFVDRDKRPEAWEAIWDLLEAVDAVDTEDPTTGENWQYMGSMQLAEEARDRLGNHRWYHQYRHRMHPRLGRRVYLTLHAP